MGEVILIDNQWGLTEINVKKSSYTWKIKNFSYAGYGKFHESPSFVIDEKNPVEWFLDFKLIGKEGDITISLNVLLGSNDSNTSYDVESTFALLDRNGERHFEKTNKEILTKALKCSEVKAFVNREDIIVNSEKLLVNDTLTVICDYVVISNNTTSSFLDCDNREKLNKVALDDFEKCFDAQEFGDVTLKVSCAKTLKAHKFVLSARSQVFRAMFNSDMIETKNNVVSIDDIDYDVLKELLRFLYAARVENLENLVVGILDAAEKYQVEGLKDICEDHLRKNVKIDNVIDTLILCNRYKMENLKKQVVHLIKIYAEDVVETDGFKSMKDSDFLTEIINILAKK